MKIIKQWAKKPQNVSKKLEHLIMEDASKCYMYVSDYSIENFLEHYYKAKIMQTIVYLSMMPNVAEYRHINENPDNENNHPSKYLLAVKWVDKADGEDLGISINKPRNEQDNFMVWWGDEKGLKYIVDTINSEYKDENERRDVYLKLIEKLAGGKNILPRKRKSKSKKVQKKTEKPHQESNKEFNKK